MVKNYVIYDEDTLRTSGALDNMTFDESEMKDRAGHYQIKQVQPKYDTKPPALYLSLEKLVHPFKDGRDSGGG